MNIETVLLIVIVTFACGFVLDRWNVRLSRSRRLVPCSLKIGANAQERPRSPALAGALRAESLDLAGTNLRQTFVRRCQNCVA